MDFKKRAMNPNSKTPTASGSGKWTGEAPEKIHYTVLLTGASGLLGANVAHELVRRGYRLKVLMRQHSDRRGISGLPCEIALGDLTEPETLEQAVNGCDALVHGAAITSIWPTSLKYFADVNVRGTQWIVEAAQRNGIKKMVHISTANTIGSGTKEKPGTEADGFNMSRFHSGYIDSKFLAEQYVLQQVEKKGLPAVIVNPTFMLGAFDLKPSSGKLLLHAKQSRVQMIPPGGKNFIHARDAAIGVCNALETGVPGERYLLAGENLSYQEFFDLVNRITGARALQVPLPAFLLKPVGWLGSKWGMLRGKASFNYVTARLSCHPGYYSGGKAVKELKLPQTAVEEAIKEALKWFEQEPYKAHKSQIELA